MDVAFSGIDNDLRRKVADALAPGTRLVPCAVDGFDADGAGRFAAIIIGPEIPIEAAIDATRAIDHAHPETSVVLVARDDPDTLKAALRAGARDVWAPDVQPEDLSVSLARVLAESEFRARQVAGSSDQLRQHTAEIVVVVTAKGGLGQTLVATSLAKFVSNHTDLSVAILDLDLQFGDVAEIMQVAPVHHVGDAVDALDDLAALKTMICEHPSGVHLLGVPEDPVAADTVDPASAGRLIEKLSAEFDFTVVDVGAGLTEHALAALDRANCVVVVTTPNPFVVRDTQRLLEVIDELGLDAKRRLVLNHASDRTGLRRRELDEMLRWPIDAAFASNPAMTTAILQGRGMEELGRSARKAMRQLAESITDHEPSHAGVMR